MITTITPTSQIYRDFNDYMLPFGLPWSSWYVGITSNIPQRLYDDHNVDAHNGNWIWKRATDHTQARSIEMDFHAAGCKGSHGGGDHRCVYVYAYRITNSTVE